MSRSSLASIMHGVILISFQRIFVRCFFIRCINRAFWSSHLCKSPIIPSFTIPVFCFQLYDLFIHLPIKLELRSLWNQHIVNSRMRIEANMSSVPFCGDVCLFSFIFTLRAWKMIYICFLISFEIWVLGKFI